MEARIQAREDNLGMDFCKLHHLIGTVLNFDPSENGKWKANYVR